MITPRDHVERPRSARTAAGVRFATDEQILEKHTENFDSIRPRTAASRGAGLERSTKEAKMFAFTAEGHMSDWQTATAHAVETAAGAPDTFPTPNFVRKSNEARSRPPDVVPPLNLAAIHHPVAKAPDAPSARHAVSSSARSSSFTPRDSERSRPRQRDQQTNSQDFLDSYRQVRVPRLTWPPNTHAAGFRTWWLCLWELQPVAWRRFLSRRRKSRSRRL